MSGRPYIIEYDSPWLGRTCRFTVEADSFTDAARKAFETTHPHVNKGELTIRVAKGGHGLGQSADSDFRHVYEYVPGETKTITTQPDVRRI